MSADERSPEVDPDAPAAVAAGRSEGDSASAGQSASLPDDQEALRAQIQETRAELGETVEALSAKADVKSQMKDKVEERKAKLRDQQAQAEVKFKEVSEQAKSNPAPFAAAAGGAIALLLIVRRLRRS